MAKLRYLLILFAIGAAALIYWLHPVVVQFKKYSVADFTEQLTPLLLIALFVERSLEVFLTVWRGGQLKALEHEVETATALPDTDPNKAAAVHAAQVALIQHRCTTKETALPTALALGILINA